jgi:polysaccharide biosynthesis PFTS motif protein
MKISRNGLRVAVFDVTPIDMATERGLGLIRNFYTDQIMTQFIRDVVAVSQRLEGELGLKIEIVLKHKRIHASIHADGYLNVVRNLEETKRIRIVPPTTNLYDLIDSSDVVVAAPFSSPAYVGHARGRAAAWYDPTCSLRPMEGNEGICHVSGCDALEEFVRGVYREKFVCAG